ncbi:MAG: septum formation protein Maf [Kiritimatiellaeota bacterium]|nr:septum formation protein Maf [Kiritimatiellota bacterium]
MVLASASPRRRRLLEQARIAATVVPADVDETPCPGEPPGETAVRLACAKAAAVAPNFPSAVVLGADTLVVLDGEPLGKPADLEQARRMLTRLSGRSHRVLTGVCLLRLEPFRREIWTTVSEVRFHRLTPAVIDDYLRRVHVLDKAGAYAIQEHGDRLVQYVHGPVSNVIGLPVEDIHRRLGGF